MTTPVHIAVNLGAFLLLMQVPTLNPTYTDLALLVGSNFIDLDHLWARPIYDSNRNGFRVHFLHKNWKVVLLFSALCVFVRPVMFLGIGVMLHYLLDYIEIRRKRL